MADAAEELTARITRMKQLIEELERASLQSAEQREALIRLHAELDAARRALARPQP